MLLSSNEHRVASRARAASAGLRTARWKLSNNVLCSRSSFKSRRNDGNSRSMEAMGSVTGVLTDLNRLRSARAAASGVAAPSPRPGRHQPAQKRSRIALEMVKTNNRRVKRLAGILALRVVQEYRRQVVWPEVASPANNPRAFRPQATIPWHVNNIPSTEPRDFQRRHSHRANLPLTGSCASIRSAGSMPAHRRARSHAQSMPRSSSLRSANDFGIPNIPSTFETSTQSISS